MQNLLKSYWLVLLLALVSLPVAADHGRHEPRYFKASQIDWVPLIAPPPAPDSMQQQRDLQTVLDMQASNRNGERRNKAIADSEANCFRLADVLGPEFDAKHMPITATFLSHAADEIDGATGILKRHWQRPRPFVVSDKVERLADVAPRKEQMDTASLHNFEYSSYPSGHATYGAACALLWTQLVPEKQAVLFQRGIEYGESRMIVGAHFPSDLLAGRIVATAAMTVMTQNKNFQHDLALARKEVQREIQLSAQPVPVAVTTKM